MNPYFALFDVEMITYASAYEIAMKLDVFKDGDCSIVPEIRHDAIKQRKCMKSIVVHTIPASCQHLSELGRRFLEKMLPPTISVKM